MSAPAAGAASAATPADAASADAASTAVSPAGLATAVGRLLPGNRLGAHLRATR
jgi:hypothetical protein